MDHSSRRVDLSHRTQRSVRGKHNLRSWN